MKHIGILGIKTNLKVIEKIRQIPRFKTNSWKKTLRRSSMFNMNYAKWIDSPNVKVIPLEFYTFNPERDLKHLDGIILTGGPLQLYYRYDKSKNRIYIR